MPFDLLPVETITYVLIISSPTAIRQCKQVCRLFRDVILENPRLQFILELDACGYIEPSNPRQDLNYVDKLRLIRETKARWLNPTSVEPTRIDLPASTAHSPTYEYADGVYVRGLRASGSANKLTRRLNFYQLPSLNKGTDYKHWSHADLGLDTRDFCICPKQNLLVLLEIVSINVPSGSLDYEEHYRVHLRTMSTNEPHPAAVRSLGAVLDYRLWARSYPDRSFYFQILGHLLAIVFRSRERDLLSYLVIWDWTTGLKLACLEMPGGGSSSFSFISEDYFVIPRNSESYDLGTPANNDTLGGLDICCLHSNKQKILSYDDCCLASFMLPALKKGQGESCLHLRCAPTPTPVTCYVQPDPFPRLYDIAPDTQLLCINIRTSSIINFPFNEPHGTLYVPSQALLNIMTQHGICPDGDAIAVRVPWGEWAEHTAWVDTREYRANNERYMHGQRAAAFSSEVEFPGDGYNAITILDFDERRVGARRVAGSGLAGEVCTPRATAEVELDQEASDSVLLPVVHERGCGQRFFEGDNVPRKSYLKTIIGMPSKYMNMFSSIMMDNEHVVVKLSGGRVILVYNF